MDCAQFYTSLNWQKTLASELLTEEETNQLKRHEAELKTLRASSCFTGRCEDRLIFDLQAKVALTFDLPVKEIEEQASVLMQS